MTYDSPITIGVLTYMLLGRFPSTLAVTRADGKQHGLQNPQGPHAGDMNNFTVAANGKAKTTVVDPRVTLMSGGNSVFAGGGTALVVHAKPDDMKSDPAGNAGDRIACGLIAK